MDCIEKEKHRRLALAICVLAVYLFYLFGNLNIYLFLTLNTTWYAALLPVLLAGTLYFCKQWDKWEYRLLVLYFLWYVLSRILCGDPALKEEYLTVIQLSVMIPFFALGLTLNEEKRKRFLDIFSGIAGGFYFLLGLLCIYTFILRIQIQNPITQQFICGVKRASGFSRLNVLDINVDTTAFWFMSSFFLMVYQFFACRQKLWRIPITLSALVDYIVMSMIYTRSVMVAMSVSLGLLVMLVLHEKLCIQKKALKGLLLAAAFLITVPLVYMSFEPVMNAFGRISISVRYEGITEEEKSDAFEQDYSNNRKLVGTGKTLNAVSSGRIMIYEAALDAIREDPSILLRGCLDDKSAEDLTRSLFEKGLIRESKFVPHYQNYLIQVLIIVGIPGLILVLMFSFLLVYKSIKVFFNREKRIPMSVKVLPLPIAATLLYEMLEIGIFTATDLRTLFFFLISGMFIGWYYDYFPVKKPETA